MDLAFLLEKPELLDDLDGELDRLAQMIVEMDATVAGVEVLGVEGAERDDSEPESVSTVAAKPQMSAPWTPVGACAAVVGAA